MSADPAFFLEQTKAASVIFPSPEFTTLTEVATEVDRLLLPASILNWFAPESEYGRFIANYADPEAYKTAIASCVDPIQTAWRYAWKIITVNSAIE